MQLRHILAVVDFSTDAGIHAVWRAAHLARTHQASLCLLSLVALADARPSTRFGATAAPARTRADLLHLAGELREVFHIVPAVIVGVGHEGHDTLRACARRADLLVLADAVPRAEQLVAEHRVPVLRVRRPGHPVRHSALVVHEPGVVALPTLVDAARWLCPSGRIHALSLMDRRVARLLQGADRAVPDIQAHSRSARHRAQAEQRLALAHAGLQHDQGTVLAAPSSRHLIAQQARLGATLVVLGQRQQPAWMAWLQANPVRQFGRRVEVDALIVPDHRATVNDARWALHPARQEAPLGTGR